MEKVWLNECSSYNIIMMCYYQGMEVAVEYVACTAESWPPIPELLHKENSEVGVVLILAYCW